MAQSVTPKNQEVQQLTYKNQREILDQANVRGLIWGLPPEIVMEEEKGKGAFAQQDPDGTLYYVDTIRGIKSSITYQFDNNKLRRARIFSEKSYVQPQNRMEDLVKMKRDLVSRFGEPIEENFRWEGVSDKKFPNQWGWAVMRGDLFITITWEDAETFVTLYLGAPEKYKPVLFVMYEDAKLKRAEALQKEQDAIRIAPINAPLGSSIRLP